jgi:hypothetical protein
MRYAMRCALLAAAGAIGSMAATTAWAQQPAPRPRGERPGIVEVPRSVRRGFWGTLSVGAGGEQVAVQQAGYGYSNTFTRPVVAVRAGGTLGPHWRLGGEAQTWIDEQGGALQTLSSFLGVAQFYPFSHAGLFVKGGLGFAHNGFVDPYGFGVADLGFAANLGLGWEAPVASQVFLTPIVEVVGQHYDRRYEPSYNERIVHVGLGVGFQPPIH